ncbi:MAG: DUF2190 family protein [Phycisphaerae bacterium]|jgi:predicted RecA/RadA family phage recombinase
MAQTFQARRLSRGDTIDYTPGSAVAAGAVVIQGPLVGIAEVPIAANALGALAVAGVFDIVKVNGSISAGAAVYWDADGDPQGGAAGSGALTTTSTDNTFVGWAVAAAGATDEKVPVKLGNVTGVTVYNDLENVIADPGDGEAIPVDDSGSCQLVTAGAETRTLAAPLRVGQLLALSMKTDGGNCVVTAAAAVNETGNNTLTFDNTGEVIILVGIEEGASKVWRVVANDGVGLTTV